MKVLPLAAALLFSSLFSLHPVLAQSSKNDEPKKEQAKKEEPKKDVLSKDVPKLPAAVTKPVPESVDDLKAIQEQVKKVVEKVTPCVVGVQIGQASGSGVIVNKDGVVLTAGHVSGKPGQDCFLILPDGKRLKGKSLGRYSDIDSGMIQITAEGKWNYCEIGKSEDLKVGQWCIAIGHPNGFQKGRTPVVRVGRILSFNRTRQGVITAVNTDCTLVGGDSGGPLFDMEGKVIGIHSRIGPTITSNTHVPIDTYTQTWDRLVKGDEIGVKVASPTVVRVRLGVIGDENAKDCKLGTVTEGSVAEKAGLKAGDVVTTFDGKPVKTFDDMVGLLAKKKPGDEVEIVVKRGSETKNIVIKFEKPEKAWLGVKADEDAKDCKLADVTDDSPAFKAGLKAGDVITKFDGKDVKTYEDMLEILDKKKPGDEVEIVIKRGSETKNIKVKLDKRG